ncbi:MAG: L-histidine N(alpha)-methyltransferase [Candidatus Pacearchaeota archaeon]|nr:L-histidine N(alpha)-methyltransferase [Candidatus Pacearchaeota archaeon]
MEFNDLIFKELLKRGYSLEGKTRVWNIADSKLWYLTPEQAQGYLDLVSTEEYKKGIGPKELTLLHNHMKSLLNEIGTGPINIVDLGCGNGKKAALFVENLRKKNVKLRYCPIDISGHMVATAMETMRNLNTNVDVVRVHWNISDFENLENVVPLLRKDEYKKSFFLLLGNTLGNFEIHELLYEIRSAMKEGDMLLIGNGLNNHKVEEDIVKSCREHPGFNKFFIYVLMQLGFNQDEVEYDVRFKNSRIEFYYTIKKDKTITFQNKKVSFSKGDQIIVAMTYHYEEDEFIGYLKMYFNDVKKYILPDGSYALALCKR